MHVLQVNRGFMRRIGFMTAVPEHDDQEAVSALLRRMTKTQARHLRLIAEDVVREPEPGSSAAQRSVSDAAPPRRHFDLIAIGRSGYSDTAERAKEIVRQEMGRSSMGE